MSALTLDRDAQGWTIFVPSADSRIMYVSAEGNDTTAQVYAHDSFTDPFEPTGEAAYATYAAAKSQTRDGYPDWVLMRRGDTFAEDFAGNILNGRSKTEPSLVGAYGSTGLSPIFKITTDGLRVNYISSTGTNIGQYIAISGIKLYAYQRNPADPGFVSGDAYVTGLSLWSNDTGNSIRNILIEGCISSFCSMGAQVYSSSSSPWVTDIDMRRNLFLSAYAVSGHSQGLWVSYVNNFLLEDNIFDHNGWLIQATVEGNNDPTGGRATMFNHNVYTAGVTNATYRNNLFMRGSSIGTKFTAPDAAENGGTDVKITGLTLEGNGYLDNEVALNICTNYFSNPYRVVSPIIRNNVVYNCGKSNQTLRNLSWGMQLAGFDAGVVYGNLLVHNVVQDFIALLIDRESRYTNIYANVAHNGGGGADELILIANTPNCTDVILRDNNFELTGTKTSLINALQTGVIDGVLLQRNNYYAPNGGLFTVVAASLSQAQWVAQYESTATFLQTAFTDDSRTVETYMVSLTETATLDAFISLARSQDRYGWDTRITAAPLVTYMKEGFNMADGALSVTYLSTLADSGTPPVDPVLYEPGGTVTVAGNGTLARAGYTQDGYITVEA